ncbi:MAG: 5'-methylthioadenosine phosphorylase [Gammaproteobacteria bacterium]|nr:5'-methylthioadenosine phosphorylase [Gammaproteobacteria bacterium]
MQLNDAPAAVILGSAFRNAPEGLELERLEIDTPWGRQTIHETLGLRRPGYLIFRHGLPHRLLPNQVAYRAQAAALAELGCRALLVTSSVGVLRAEIPLFRPLLVKDIVMLDNRLPDGSACTMFVEPGADQGHLIIDEGLCSPALNRQIADIARRLETPVAMEVVFAYLGGPRIKTKAENRLWAGLGVDVDAMTLAPEIVLANELGIPSAALVVGHKYSLPDASVEYGDVDESLRRSHATQERIIVEFLCCAEPVAFGNRLYRYADKDAAHGE